MQRIVKAKIEYKSQALLHLKNSFLQHSVERKIENKKSEILQLKNSFNQTIEFKIQNAGKELNAIFQRFPDAINANFQLAQNQLIHLKKMLESNNPKFKTKQGYAQLSLDSQVVDIDVLQVDDLFELQSDKIRVHAKVINKEIIK